MRSIFTVFFLFTVALVRGQDITGVWQGHFQSPVSATKANPFMMDDRYKFEVQVAQDGKLFQAVTYSYLTTFFYGKADAKGTVNPKTGKVLLQEGKLLEMRMAGPGNACTMTCFLQYTKIGGEEFLEGHWVSMNIKDSSNCGRGTIMLRKVESSLFYKEPFLVKKEEEMKKDSAVAVSKAKPGDKNHAAAHKGPTPGSPPTAKISGKPETSGKPGTVTSGKPGVSAGTVTSGKPGVSAGKTTGTVAKTTKPAAVKPPSVKGVTPSLARIEHSRDSLGRIPAADSGTALSRRAGPMIIPSVLKSRSNELVRAITVNTNEVTLSIYDDGAIDHDTISVYLDKKQVISHAMLTDRAIVLTLHLDGTDNYHELVMVAENEGEIPPNTSLMIVNAGDKRYEVRITSTEQKNAVVVFRYEKSAK
ncbi:MAG TPA: hypothetical protein VE035_09790 [Puia sp.]|nr:hypothetical protein [Puia sp.]